MATSYNSRDFARRLHLLATAVRKNTVKVVKRAAIAADQAAVLSTPVDTGRARANWLVTIGSPAPGALVSFAEGSEGSTKGPVTNEALQQARDTIDTWKLGIGAIYITNNVRYIIFLDAGWSAQAPHGMTAAALRAAARQLGSVKLLGGA